MTRDGKIALGIALGGVALIWLSSRRSSAESVSPVPGKTVNGTGTGTGTGTTDTTGAFEPPPPSRVVPLLQERSDLAVDSPDDPAVLRRVNARMAAQLDALSAPTYADRTSVVVMRARLYLASKGTNMPNTLALVREPAQIIWAARKINESTIQRFYTNTMS